MIPRLATARLVLDAFTLDDVPALVELAGHPEIYATTLLIEHPYKPEHAQNWIASHLPVFLKGERVNFAVRGNGKLIGSVSLHVNRLCDRGTFGYWIGRPYWNQGYATEALRALFTHGFQQYALEKIEAEHFASNDASGRVMQKVGMTREGLRPRHFKKDGKYIDAVLYGITRDAAITAGLISAESAASIPTPPAPTRVRHPDDPPFAEELVAPGASSLERAQLLRHFRGKTFIELEQDLRVYGKSLAPDFANLAPGVLGYYLKSAQAYLESEHAEGDWDFAHGLVSALAAQLRGGALPPPTQVLAQTLVRHVRDNAARYLIEADKQPFAGWIAEALKG